MRFKQFLEAQVRPYESQTLALNDLASHILEHCQDAINNPIKIWRGTKKKIKSGLYNPGTGERKSQNTSNQYTRLLDSNPANKDFPLRSKSFIATTHRDQAGEYGHMWGDTNRYADPHLFGSLMLVYPYDGVELGVVNKSDIWDVNLQFTGKVLNKKVGITTMNTIWTELFELVGEDAESTPSLTQLMAILRKSDPQIIYKKLIKEDVIDRNDSIAEELVEDFINQLPTVYSYAKMGCSLETVSSLSKQRSEIWFSGRCIMVNDSDIEALNKIMKEKD